MLMSIVDALNLKNIDDIDYQIAERRVFIGNCVGTLWPSIVSDEIQKLIKRKREIILLK